MFVTSGFPPKATDETSELTSSDNRKYFGSFIKQVVERNQAKEARQAKQVVHHAGVRGMRLILQL
jgi:hypothetical protein